MKWKIRKIGQFARQRFHHGINKNGHYIDSMSLRCLIYIYICDNMKRQLSPFFRENYKDGLESLEVIRRALENIGLRDVKPEFLPVTIRIMLGYGTREGMLLDGGLIGYDEPSEDDMAMDMQTSLSRIWGFIDGLGATFGDQMGPYLKDKPTVANRPILSFDRQEWHKEIEIATEYADVIADDIETEYFAPLYYATEEGERRHDQQKALMAQRRAEMKQKQEELRAATPRMPPHMTQALDKLAKRIQVFNRLFVFDESKLGEAFETLPHAWPAFFVVLSEDEETVQGAYVGQRLRCVYCGRLNHH